MACIKHHFGVKLLRSSLSQASRKPYKAPIRKNFRYTMDDTFKPTDIKCLPGSFASAWQSPSNIAIVKYWGKLPGQLPANPSLSLTLEKCHTETRLEMSRRDTAKEGFDVKIYFGGQEKPSFAPGVRKVLFTHRTICSVPQGLLFYCAHRQYISTLFRHSVLSIGHERIGAMPYGFREDMRTNNGRPGFFPPRIFLRPIGFRQRIPQHLRMCSRLGKNAGCGKLVGFVRRTCSVRFGTSGIPEHVRYGTADRKRKQKRVEYRRSRAYGRSSVRPGSASSRPGTT